MATPEALNLAAAEYEWPLHHSFPGGRTPAFRADISEGTTAIGPDGTRMRVPDDSCSLKMSAAQVASWTLHSLAILGPLIAEQLDAYRREHGAEPAWWTIWKRCVSVFQLGSPPFVVLVVCVESLANLTWQRAARAAAIKPGLCAPALASTSATAASVRVSRLATVLMGGSACLSMLHSSAASTGQVPGARHPDSLATRASSVSAGISSMVHHEMRFCVVWRQKAIGELSKT